MKTAQELAAEYRRIKAQARQDVEDLNAGRDLNLMEERVDHVLRGILTAVIILLAVFLFTGCATTGLPSVRIATRIGADGKAFVETDGKTVNVGFRLGQRGKPKPKLKVKVKATPKPTPERFLANAR